MEIELTITDVTRMKKPRVCIGAIADGGDSVRPVLPYPGIQEQFLYSDPHHVIRPFSRITLNLIKPVINPPHTEDWQFTKRVFGYREVLGEPQKIQFLQNILDPSVNSIFGTSIHRSNGGGYVAYGKGRRSLGTIKVKVIEGVQITSQDGKLRYQIGFQDQTGNEFTLSITDLSFRYYVNYLISREHYSPSEISHLLTDTISKADTYLRIGLGRAWSPSESMAQTRCYLFITGVYSFPDYLGGKCFADFKLNDIAPGYTEDDEIPF